MALALDEQFGPIDIYVFDQILRGRIAPSMRVLDAGCGYGRNLIYLLRQGCQVYALDSSFDAVESVREMAAHLHPTLPRGNVQVGEIAAMPFPNALVDVVMCNSVLHFARDAQHFDAMLQELWRVLAPGGLLFCRLGSHIGMSFEQVSGHHYRIGDGSVWFLVDEAMLLDRSALLGGSLADPLKTTVVQGHRCMTTWVLRKPEQRGGVQA